MLDRFHKISEIVASLAIVGSLIFVGVQVGQNTDAVRISTAQSLVTNWGESNRDIYGNKEMLSLFSRIFEGQSVDMDTEDGTRARLWIESGIRQAEFNYYNWINGDLDERYWGQSRAGLVTVLSIQPGRDTWSAIRLNHGPEFRKLADGLHAQQGPSASTISEGN